MITVKEKSTIANISELRSKANSDRIFRDLKDHKVILEKHNRPVAVMMDYKNYEEMERLIELAEDYLLGLVAKDRDQRAKKSDFVSIEKW